MKQKIYKECLRTGEMDKRKKKKEARGSRPPLTQTIRKVERVVNIKPPLSEFFKHFLARIVY